MSQGLHNNSNINNNDINRDIINDTNTIPLPDSTLQNHSSDFRTSIDLLINDPVAHHIQRRLQRSAQNSISQSLRLSRSLQARLSSRDISTLSTGGNRTHNTTSRENMPFDGPVITYPSSEAMDNRGSRRRGLTRSRTSFEGLRENYKTSGRDTKKRKVDESGMGQVGKVKLPMTLAFHDGGRFDKQSHPVENVLKQDQSVYCSKRSSCNLVLEHQSKSLFAIEKLVIKAPGTLYTSPVSEGMVFIMPDTSIPDMIENTKLHAPLRRGNWRANALEDNDSDAEEGEEGEDDDDDDDDEQDDYMPLLNQDFCPYDYVFDDGRLTDPDDDELERDSVQLMSLRAAAGAAGMSMADILAGDRNKKVLKHDFVVVKDDPVHSDDGMPQPHAKFHISRGSTKSTVYFDPPLYDMPSKT